MDYKKLTRDELQNELIEAKKELAKYKAESEDYQNLLTILDSLPDMILRVDKEMQIVWANKAALDKRPNAIGKKCYETYLGKNEACNACPCVKALETGEIVRGTIALSKSENSENQTIWDNVGIPFLDENGCVTGMLEISRNITEREHFKRKFEEYAEALEESKNRSDQINESNKELIKNLSHELKTPMNGIFGMVQLLEAAELNPLQREYIEIIATSSEKMMLVLNNVLDDMNIKAGRLVISNDPFNVKKMFDELVNVYSKQAHEKDLQFISRMDSSIPEYLLGDLKRLRQSLINLLGNAIKYTDKGQIEFSLDILEATSHSVTLNIVVNDTGVGVKDSQQQMVLRGINGGDKHGGFELSGIGLAVSKQIVDLMGGELHLSSESYKGTQVEIKLELERTQALAIEDKKTVINKRKDNGKPRILIAEDEVIGRVTMKLMLKDRYDVVFAKNGQEAVNLYFEVEPDLVLMDILMPDMNGFEAYDAIEKKALSRVPIIACTAKVISTEKAYLTSYGFDDYLSKPIDSKLLNQMLERYLSQEN